MKQISLILPRPLLKRLRECDERSEFIRMALEKALDQELRGHRRRRHSARYACSQTTLMVPAELDERLEALRATGELSSVAELALTLALAGKL